MTQKIAIIGANGQLGNDLLKVFDKEKNLKVIPLTHYDIEITDKDSVTKELNEINPDIIINTAAYNNVDDAENNPQEAFLVNSISNKYLSEYCNKKKSTYVYISTDYVFGGDKDKKKPYLENDCPNPINAYGISKLSGEYFTKYGCEKYFILRTSGLFGVSTNSGKRKNFITSILEQVKKKDTIKVVNDQLITPTYTYDLAKQIAILIKTDYFGVYHASSEGFCSWYEFTKKIFYLMNINCSLEPIQSAQITTGAKRPSYSVLENFNLKNKNINIMREWQDGLKDFLTEKGYII